MVVMGLISRVLDAAVVAFSAAVAVAAPLIDAQALVPARLVPAPVAELRRRYAAEFGDYLVAELPLFFRGLVLVEIAFLWPLSLANLYGVLAGRRWASTTSLMAGVSSATSMVRIKKQNPNANCCGNHPRWEGSRTVVFVGKVFNFGVVEFVRHYHLFLPVAMVVLVGEVLSFEV